jgi:hypothetical protein
MKNTTFKMLSLFVLIVSACTKEKTVNGALEAVVEGYLMDDQPVEIKISKESITGTIDSLEPITGLSVVVINNGIAYPLNDAGNGLYQNSSLTARQGETYELQFEYNNEKVSAVTKVPEKPSGFQGSATTLTAPLPPSPGTIPTRPDPVTFTWSNPSNDYHLMLVRYIGTDSTEINTGGAIRLGRGTFRTEPTQLNTQDVMPMQFKYYGLHEVLLYRILPEYAALYEDNGTNSNNLTDPPGNIVNGQGIFTGVTVADKLYLTLE